MQRVIHDIVPIEGGEDDHRCFLVVPLPYFLCHFKAVHFRHFPIEQHKSVRLMLGVLHFQHLQSHFPVVAGIRLDAHFVQHDSRMFRRDLLVVHHENAHILQIDMACHRPLMLAVGQRDDDGEFRSHALLRFDGDRAVHQFNDVFRDRHAETRAAELAAPAAVLLGECVEDLWDERGIHPDAGIPYAELQGGMIAEHGGAFNREGDVAGRIREFDRIGKDVDEHLLELHVIADIIVADASDDAAFILEPFFVALGHHHGVQLFQHAAEGKFLLSKHKAAGFDSAHVQNVVDQAQQMACAPADFLQIFTGLYW